MNKHISLSITERCNLNCIYCFEKSKKNQSMSFDTAIRVLTHELENSPEFDEISCDFMGGEPFLEFELIKNVCEYFWNRNNPKKITFYTTTNGTLVHNEIKEWLRTNRHRFSCMLSLDGSAASHNANRSNSFDRIDIPFFLEMWPDIKVKAITSKETLPKLCDNVIFLHEQGFRRVEMKLAYGFDWSDDLLCRILREELEKLVAFYIDNIELIPCTMLNVDFSHVNSLGKQIKKWCSAGYNTVSYDMDGNLFPCRYFQDLVKAGHLTHIGIWEYDYRKIQDQLCGQCNKCLLRDLCRTCYAYNYEKTHNFGAKDMLSCRITRITIEAAAQLLLGRNEITNQYSEKVVENANTVCLAAKNNRWLL